MTKRITLYTAAWCPPCKAVKKMLARPENADVRERIDVVDVDSEEGGKQADALSIHAIPTWILPHGKRTSGSLSARDLRLALGLLQAPKKGRTP